MRRIRLGNLEVDCDRFEVHISGARIDLTFLEFELLAHLAQHSGRVVSAERLIEAAWGEAVEGSTGKLRIHISRLRKKVHGSRPWSIQTVQKRGYVLTDGAHTGANNAGEGLVAQPLSQHTLGG